MGLCGFVVLVVLVAVVAVLWGALIVPYGEFLELDESDQTRTRPTNNKITTELLKASQLPTWREVVHVSAHNLSHIHALCKLGVPFVVDDVVPQSQTKLDVETSFALDELVRVYRYVRKLPVSPQTSRLYATDSKVMPLGEFVHSM
jgi:hypothetical protein